MAKPRHRTQVVDVNRSLFVGGRSAGDTRGIVRIGGNSIRCALGRGGRKVCKREGDGATPIGRWKIREVFYRSDRVARPICGVPVRSIRPLDGWCDAARDPNYNRRVVHPYPASAERMWRADHLYDVVVVLGYNDMPRSRGRGSAIFLHLARADYMPTEGCVAVSHRDMSRLLRCISRRTYLRVGG